MFRTEISIVPQERQLARTARVLTLGSCFADSIGERLRQNKVQTLVNPFGTVFQPLALARLLRAAAGEEQDWQQHLVEARGRWQSYDFHGTLGADSPVELLQLIQQRVQQVGDFVRQADAVVLTLGTAWVYRLRETDELVSNLHKLPAGLFVKELLTADEIVNALAEVHALLRQLNANIRIVLTVSPVRHLKDTLPLSAVSKSVLRVACHYLSELLPGVSYFPAYELLNDDLRDYRFYATDMLHPSEAAEDYVWDKFARAYFDADFGRFRKEWAAVRQSLTHRPLHDGAPEHRQFLDQTAERLERLASQGVEVRQELRDVQRQLAALPPPRPTRAPLPEPVDDGEERIDVGGDSSDETLTTEGEAAARTREGRGRNRRGRGRGRDREERPDRRTPQLAPAEAEAAAEPPTDTDDPLTDADVAHDLALAEDALEATTADEAVETAAALEAANPTKKKKRRSRGGAKRTARKNAARLAAEQVLDDETNLPVDAETGTVDAGPTEELSLLADMVLDELADEPPVAATPAGPQAPLVSEPIHEPAAEVILEAEAEAELLDAADAEPVDPELIAEEQPLAEEKAPAAAPRRRGTGPTPKKSKVITKSTQVKRPKRTPLFRNADEAAPQAPVISTPILPEALLERPAVAELLETPAILPAAAPPRPRRGRPKAAPATDAVPEPVATEPAASAPAATRPKRAAKAKPKPEPTNPDAPRRGRPPGRKATPPAAENPAS